MTLTQAICAETRWKNSRPRCLFFLNSSSNFIHVFFPNHLPERILDTRRFLSLIANVDISTDLVFFFRGPITSLSKTGKRLVKSWDQLAIRAWIASRERGSMHLPKKKPNFGALCKKQQWQNPMNPKNHVSHLWKLAIFGLFWLCHTSWELPEYRPAVGERNSEQLLLTLEQMLTWSVELEQSARRTGWSLKSRAT